MFLCEGLFELFEVGEQPQIGCAFVCRGGKTRKGIEDADILFSGIGLAGDGEDLGKAHLLSYEGFKLFNFFRIAFKKVEERSLCSCGSFDAEKVDFA